jgi:energy-coupling factor transport system ATP-binding protein
MISVQDFSYRFSGNEQYTLRNIDLEIAAGDFVVLTGPSGCGKSTLALAIGGFLFSQYDGNAEGRVLIKGLDVQNTPVFEIADVVGLVQQNPEAQFCTLTVKDEIAFGLENRCLAPNEIRERLKWSLEIVNGQHLIDRELASLSGGEKQKVTIAAMMASKPQVLIFDEPTSNLDPTATQEIFKVIAELRSQVEITVIVIEHKTQYLSKFSPRLISMEAGSILQDKSPDVSKNTWSFNGQKRSKTTNSTKPIIEIKNLAAGYNGQNILKNVSLQIYPGEFVAIMGDNGSGKTTFLKNLMGLSKPISGKIEIFGKSTADIPVHKQARQVGLVFQNPEHQLFANSVWEEVTLAPGNFGVLDEKVLESAEYLLSSCGLADHKEKHPYRLSYGEKKRLNLISVLTYSPSLLLLDEILIGQDQQNAAFLLGLLAEQTISNRTVLMANHNPQVTYHYASRLIFFEDGKVLIDAPTEEGFSLLAEAGKTSYLPDYEAQLQCEVHQ